jgi:Tfp pilus assembly protein PilF
MTEKSALLAGLALSFALVLGACRLPPAFDDVRRGVLASEDGRWDEAVASWTKALEADPSSVAAHNNLAVAYEKSGRFAEARREYEAALKLDPRNTAVKENYRRFRESRGSGAEDELRRSEPPPRRNP